MLAGLTLRDVLVTLAIAAGVLLGIWFVLWACTCAIRRLACRLQEKNRARVEEIERGTQQFIQLVRRTVMAIAAVLALFFLLRRMGLRREMDWADLGARMAGTSLRILLIIIGAYFLGRLLQLLLSRLPLLISRSDGSLAERLEREKRVTTISRMMGWMITAVVMSIAGLMALRELEVNITPILTGAGIVGLAVGFGAQNLVRDVISGFFLILEDQVRVGDVVVINGKSGVVESIRLRTIVLRDFDGTAHIIPNGVINELSNHTKDYSYYVIELAVDYKEDVDRVVATLREVSRELEADPVFHDLILEPLEIVGVDAFADSGVILKMRIKTVPRQQWVVGRELRRRIKKVFDQRGIEIPYNRPVAVQVLGETPGDLPPATPAAPDGDAPE